MKRSPLILSTVLVIHATTSATAIQTSAVRSEEQSQPRGARHHLPERVVTEVPVITMTSTVRLVGREVSLRDVLIDRVGPHGFWIATPGSHAQVFVLPAEGRLVSPRAGDVVSVHGEIWRMGERLQGLLGLRFTGDEHVYVRAFTVRPTGLWRRAAEKSEVQPVENRLAR